MIDEEEIKKAQEQEMERIKKDILRRVLTKEAMERLGRVRMVNPVLTQQIELYLLQLYQTGQIKEAITDEKLKEILNMLTEKKEWKIKRI
ncbi:MAG: DNA-binding protein [Candidatus Aenigmarchaeota archaeon]|nr:DNA-binding protein [Candidatus Aenigmarchaeota archaeon]